MTRLMESLREIAPYVPEKDLSLLRKAGEHPLSDSVKRLFNPKEIEGKLFIGGGLAATFLKGSLRFLGVGAMISGVVLGTLKGWFKPR